MTPEKILLCKLILKLDKIPRYGRLYHVEPRMTVSERSKRKPEWRFMRNGLWGFYLLDRLGWLHQFMDTQWTIKPRSHNGFTYYELFHSPAWRLELKWRRHVFGVWPKTKRNRIRASRTRGMSHEATTHQS